MGNNIPLEQAREPERVNPVVSKVLRIHHLFTSMFRCFSSYVLLCERVGGGFREILISATQISAATLNDI